MPTDKTRSQLEEELKRLLLLEAEAASTIGYHDLRRKGLVGTQQAYTALREQVQAQLAALPS